jgi:hypothetical protein
VKTNKNAVNKTAQINKGILYRVKPLTLILKIVVMKLIEPAIDEAPAKCKLKIAKSTEPPGCATIPDNGG